MRTLSPTSSFTSVSPSPTSITSNSLQSQKSPGSDVERRPKKGDEDYIKRPENAFILFRRKCCEERQAQEEEAATSNGLTKKQRQADLSKTISQQWKSLTPEEKKYWVDLANEKKKEHAQRNPGYVYRPVRQRDKDGKVRNKKRKRTDTTMVETGPSKAPESLSFAFTPPRQHGRSISAPTPPPLSYQSIQIPNLYSSSPSCPSSPSLLPMISRRAAHTGSTEDIMETFDFTPSNEHLLAPAFGHEQGNVQSSEFLRNMFNMPSSQALLTVSTDASSLLPAHQLSSPASSGPPSPAAGPFTPTHPMHPHSGIDMNGFLNTCVPDSQLQADLDMQMQMSPAFDVSSYSWSATSIWQDETNMGMTHADFDLGSIPSLEIGGPKYVDTTTYVTSPEAIGMSEYSQEYPQEYQHEYMTEYQDYVQLEQGQYLEGHQSAGSSLLGFDNMMGSPEQSF
jgi:hypothetical protein